MGSGYGVYGGKIEVKVKFSYVPSCDLCGWAGYACSTEELAETSVIEHDKSLHPNFMKFKEKIKRLEEIVETTSSELVKIGTEIIDRFEKAMFPYCLDCGVDVREGHTLDCAIADFRKLQKKVAKGDSHG